MMFRRLSFIFFFLIINFTLYAQPFWMQPKNFFLQEGERLSVAFRTGSNFTGHLWEFGEKDIAEIKLHQLSRESYITDSLHVGEKESLKLVLPEPGTSLIALSTEPVIRTVPGEEFDDYLKDNGLDEALSKRKKENKLLASAQESIVFYSKLLIRSEGKSDDTYKKTIGYPAEIIPLSDPYQLKIGDEVRFKILINGKPVFGTRAKVCNRYNNRTTIQNIYTEQDGTILVRISSPGPWMISFAAMEPMSDGDLWKTNHASFVFGVKK